MGKLSGKVALITGGNRGIGRAAAVLFARHGAKVAVTGRDAAAGAETERLVRAAGGECVFHAHDVANEADWERVVGDTVARFGGLDVVVNNAGAFLLQPTTEATEADWDRIFDINCTGTWLGVKHGFHAIAKTGRGGAIVNVSSLMGLVGFPQNAAYCASKGAVTGMTKSAAAEGAMLSPPVRVNSLHPGVIWTEMITSQFGDDQALSDHFASETPLKIIGLPEYMADAILFLASDDSTYVTGAALTVDGGRGAD
jgi:NAD(P)-dependent dehydrogenase (short-subunit alcohol dehydrogenase family)